jgi:dTDP-glucose 4,6-dehydratase
MRVIFTGEEGNLATGCATALREAGVVVPSVNPRLKSVQTRYHPWPELSLDKQAVAAAIRETEADVVVHTAALVNTDKCQADPREAINVNLWRTHCVLEACGETGARLLYFSTTATYDPRADRPFVESTEQRPPTLYGITKLAGEHLVCGQKIVPWMVVRPCFVFGHPPRDHSSQICKMAVHQALLESDKPERAGLTREVTLNPKCHKDYMPLQDFAEAVVAMLTKGRWGEIYNVAAEADRPMGEYFDTLRDEFGLAALDMEWLAHEDYMQDHVVSSDKLRRDTGWKPKIDPIKAVRRLAAEARDYVRACDRGYTPLLY